MEFKQRLRDLRQDKDISQAKLGKILNIQQAAIPTKRTIKRHKRKR